MHIDMNSYFASVEQQANPFLRGKAIGVTGKRFDTNRENEAQRSIIATASREAKMQGIKTGMGTAEAKRLLPSLIIVPGDPEKYSEITHRFVTMFHELTSTVQQTSVDECYLDVTHEAKDYFGATMMAQAIREQLREVCGEAITASIGIGPNKLIAKLASESHKPNGLTVVPPQKVMGFTNKLQLRDFCGIGWRTERHLANLGVTTVEGLRNYPVDGLTREFKSWGLWLHEAAYGRDNTPVIADDEPQKSMGHSYTLPKDVDDPETLKRTLLGLADKVAWRLRRDGFAAGQVSVYFHFADLSGNGQQQRFQEPTADGLTLFRTAWSLIERWWDGTPVRLIGITAGMLSKKVDQQPLFKKEQKLLSVIDALDRVQSRFGSKSWTRASLVDVEFKARSSGWHYDHEL